MLIALVIIEAVIIAFLVIVIVRMPSAPPEPSEPYKEQEINRMERTLTNRAGTWKQKYWIITIRRTYESGRMEHRTEEVRVG